MVELVLLLATTKSPLWLFASDAKNEFTSDVTVKFQCLSVSQLMIENTNHTSPILFFQILYTLIDLVNNNRSRKRIYKNELQFLKNYS